MQKQNLLNATSTNYFFRGKKSDRIIMFSSLHFTLLVEDITQRRRSKSR